MFFVVSSTWRHLEAMEVFNQAYDELTGANSFKVSAKTNYTSTGKSYI